MVSARVQQLSDFAAFFSSGLFSQIPPLGYEPEGREFESLRALHFS